MDSLRITMPQELFAPAAFQHFEDQLDLPVLKAGPDLYDFEGPLSWQADVTNTGGALLVTGEVRGTARTSCARCLKEFSFPVVGEIEGYFLIDPADERSDDEEEFEEEFEVLADDRTIDFLPLITAALRLEFPLIPLCSDDCKGLCPTCGADLNEGPCACGADAGVKQQGDEDAAPKKDNPFSVLKNYEFEQ